MSEKLELALAQIALVVSGVSGIQQAFTYPRDEQNIFPFAAIYVATGNIGVGPIGTRKSLTNINIDVIKNRLDLGADLAILAPFLDTVPTALIAQISGTGARFNATISTFTQVNYVFVPVLEYSTVPCIAYRFVMQDVKILQAT